MKSRILALLVVLVLVVTVSLSADTLRVGVVLSIGGLGDESFNDAAYQGVMHLRKEGDCIVEVVEPGSISGIEPALRYFCQRNMDMICAVGIFANDAVRRVATDFPESRLVLIDSVVTMPNVLSILFDEEQGSFYAGAFAALASRSGVTGFLGGMESPVIASFERGFKNGVKFVNPDAIIVSRYIGSTPEAFDMPERAYSLGMDMAKQGADMIYHASGRSGLGLIQASRRANFLVIGVDSDQSRSAPGKVPASMVKRIDNALLKAAEIMRKDAFTGGIWTMSLQDHGIELAHSRFNRDILSADKLERLKEIEDFLMYKATK